MKIRLGLITLLLITLAVLLMRNDERILNALFAAVNPLKQQYVLFTERLGTESQNYLFQKETIDRLRKENMALRKRILTQKAQIEAFRTVYDALPQLKRYAPTNGIVPVHTISYVKLNTLSEVVLSKPEGLKEGEMYGLLDNDTVAGVATVKHGQLYGYLLSDNRCRFAVYLGDAHAPGIAEGAGENRMIIKFIPKWYAIHPGDAVITSGLDRIFFPSLPVGTVLSVETRSAYKVATVRTFADIYHPKIFFLIKQSNILPALQTLTPNVTSSSTHNAVHASQTDRSTGSEVNTTDETRPAKEEKAILQTRDDVVEPEEPTENRPKKKRKIRRKRHTQPDALDLF